MKKIIPYIFILALVLTGIFSMTKNAEAQITGSCWNENTQRPAIQYDNKDDCLGGGPSFSWEEVNQQTQTATTTDAPKTYDPSKSQFENAVNQKTCRLWGDDPLEGCLLGLFYNIFFRIPAGILTIVGQLFNSVLSLTMSTTLYGSGFIEGAWTVVRDLSNVFFILILLYIAIQTILGLGGHDSKKMIGWVVIMALLINFSMFFTKVVIDASNILALVFYDKINIETRTGAPEYKSPVNTKDGTGVPTKDIGGNLVGAFNITETMNENLLGAKVEVFGRWSQPVRESTSLMILIILVAGVIMLFASYAFFISAFSFLGRLIELWILIIFSPFAFMSFPVPKLSGVEGIGWSSWSKKLLEVAFMAPIFMFFMYLIARISKNTFLAKPEGTTSFIPMLLMIIIPSMIYIILLMKATDYAKKGGGEMAKALMKGGAMLGGFAVGAATGGTALVARGTIGRKAMDVANNDDLRRRAAEGEKGAQRKLATANYFASKSFDARQTGLGKFTEKQTGMKFDSGLGVLGLDTKSLKGGRKAEVDHEKEHEIDKVKTYELSGAAARRQNERNSQYQIDKLQAEASQGKFSVEGERVFREAYERGDNNSVQAYGVTRQNIGAGRVGTSAQENQARRDNYATNLENKHHDEEAMNAVESFYSQFKKGAAKMVTTPLGAGATLAAGAATFGVGAVAAPIVGGLLYALKTQVLGIQGVHATDSEVTSAIRKGEDKDKKLLKMIKDSQKDDHAPAAAHAPAAPAHAPAATHAPAEDHGGGHGGGH